jgi:hypothetical protein
MADELPSLDDLLAQSERMERDLLAMRKDAEAQVVTAQDDWSMVEIAVNGNGDVVEVALNESKARNASMSDLAEAVLAATRAAQQRAREAAVARQQKFLGS